MAFKRYHFLPMQKREKVHVYAWKETSWVLGTGFCFNLDFEVLY